MKKNISDLIYLCEDDPGIQMVVEEVLEDAGFTVLVFDNAEEMLKTAAGALPDLLIIDWWLPALGGEKVVRIWHADKEMKEIPCLVISAAGEIKGEALACGATGFLAKPFNISELTTAVKKLISVRGNIDNNAKS